jgi:TPR repeat protein
VLSNDQAWFKAKQGDLEAIYVLGMCHLHGVQQDKSTKSAASWLSKAASGGHVGAQFQIGLMWLEGKGVTRQDDNEATKWLQKAAAESHPEALFNMGVLSLDGRGMPKSGKEAASYFKQAAQLGNKEVNGN